MTRLSSCAGATTTGFESLDPYYPLPEDGQPTADTFQAWACMAVAQNNAPLLKLLLRHNHINLAELHENIEELNTLFAKRIKLDITFLFYDYVQAWLRTEQKRQQMIDLVTMGDKACIKQLLESITHHHGNRLKQHKNWLQQLDTAAAYEQARAHLLQILPDVAPQALEAIDIDAHIDPDLPLATSVQERTAAATIAAIKMPFLKEAQSMIDVYTEASSDADGINHVLGETSAIERIQRFRARKKRFSSTTNQLKQRFSKQCQKHLTEIATDIDTFADTITTAIAELPDTTAASTEAGIIAVCQNTRECPERQAEYQEATAAHLALQEKCEAIQQAQTYLATTKDELMTRIDQAKTAAQKEALGLPSTLYDCDDDSLLRVAEANVDPNALTASGDTLLINALKRRHAECVDVLLDAGACYEKRSEHDGHSADFAAEHTLDRHPESDSAKRCRDMLRAQRLFDDSGLHRQIDTFYNNVSQHLRAYEQVMKDRRKRGSFWRFFTVNNLRLRQRGLHLRKLFQQHGRIKGNRLHLVDFIELAQQLRDQASRGVLGRSQLHDSIKKEIDTLMSNDKIKDLIKATNDGCHDYMKKRFHAAEIHTRRQKQELDKREEHTRLLEQALRNIDPSNPLLPENRRSDGDTASPSLTTTDDNDDGWTPEAPASPVAASPTETTDATPPPSSAMAQPGARRRSRPLTSMISPAARTSRDDGTPPRHSATHRRSRTTPRRPGVRLFSSPPRTAASARGHLNTPPRNSSTGSDERRSYKLSPVSAMPSLTQ